MLLQTNTLAQESPKTISVTGQGTVYAEPDIAMLNISIDIQDSDLGKATNDTNAVILKVKKVLGSLGVTEEDIRTSSFNVWPQQRYDLEGNPTVEGYQVNHVLGVTIHDIDSVGEILTESINAGANGVNNIRYTFSDDSELEKEARAKAMENAQEKADQLAELARTSIVGVMSISEQTDFGSPIFSAQPQFEVMSSVAENVPVSTGQLAVKVTLAVSFLIE